MPQAELLRLQRIAVDGLFDLYDHDIRLNLDDRVTILHGPNGVGKTVVLGMIRALLQGQFEYFDRFPFSRFLLEFHDGSTLSLQANGRTANGDAGYVLTLETKGEVKSANVSGMSRADLIASRADYLRPHEELAGTWVDMRDGEELDARDVLSRYSEFASEHRGDEDDMSWFPVFLETFTSSRRNGWCGCARSGVPSLSFPGALQGPRGIRRRREDQPVRGGGRRGRPEDLHETGLCADIRTWEKANGAYPILPEWPAAQQ